MRELIVLFFVLILSCSANRTNTCCLKPVEVRRRGKLYRRHEEVKHGVIGVIQDTDLAVDGHQWTVAIGKVEQSSRVGLSGALAGFLQVVLLMWLRTTINYQYRHGGSILETFQTLYRDGGIPRFYKGFGFAVMQGPLAKFGSIASNEYSLLVCKRFFPSNMALVTATGSVLAAIWRLLLMPIDTCKTVAQVGGAPALHDLLSRAAGGDFGRLYRGGSATMLSTAIAHYPWFLTYNALQRQLPVPTPRARRVARDAFVGFAASTASDLVANPMRVLKTLKQSVGLERSETLTYSEALSLVMEGPGGLWSLFHRGLWARMITNGVQSMIFTILLGVQRNTDKQGKK